MGKTWVLPLFKQLLIDASEEFMNTSDKAKDKPRTALVARVADQIRQLVDGTEERLPDELEKAIRTWFGNEAAGFATGQPGKKSKADTRGHPTSVRSWTAKSVCGKLHAEMISEIQTRLSGGEEKLLAFYTPALGQVFTALSEEEKERCEQLANEWNKTELPEEVQRRYAKKIPSEVAEWLEYMKNKTGAVFFMLAAYTDEDGGLSIAKYETNELGFMTARKEHRKGQNNITDVWTTFIEDKEDMTHSDETLELDAEGYPHLPDDVLGLRLSRKKAVIRQFVAAVRRYYKQTGRIPWTSIAENPSHHLTKRSRPDSDHKLIDPSHMKAEGVDDWLKHWFRLQQKKKYPLILKDPSEAQSDDPTQSLKRSKGTEKGKAVRTRKGKEKALPESSEDEDSDQNVGDENEYVNNDKPDSGNGENTPASGSGSGNVPQDESKLPPAPSSAGKSKKSRIAFLKSLSEDRNYRQLIKLLHAAKSGPLTGTPGPPWASWRSKDHFLPKAFHQVNGAGSLSKLKSWLRTDPLTMDDENLTSYDRVEIIALAIGLAMRDLWVNQFPEEYSGIPPHVSDSPLEFREYQQLSYDTKTLIDGYEDLFAQIAERYPESSVPEDDEDGSNENDTNTKTLQKPKGRQPGLASVPQSLLTIREEVGLSGQGWEDLGKPWHTLAALWLRAEVVLGKSGRPDLKYAEIHASTLPASLKDWMCCKIMRVDCSRPGEPFGNEFTNYLVGLPWSSLADSNSIMDEIWCRPGRTGIIVLLVGLYWQALYSGSGKKWASNLERVETIFRAILNAPMLQRAKRGRAESQVPASEPKRRRTQK